MSSVQAKISRSTGPGRVQAGLQPAERGLGHATGKVLGYYSYSYSYYYYYYYYRVDTSS